MSFKYVQEAQGTVWGRRGRQPGMLSAARCLPYLITFRRQLIFQKPVSIKAYYVGTPGRAVRGCAAVQSTQAGDLIGRLKKRKCAKNGVCASLQDALSHRYGNSRVFAPGRASPFVLATKKNRARFFLSPQKFASTDDSQLKGAEDGFSAQDGPRSSSSL